MIPRRLKREANHHALVDGIPFALPVRSMRMQAVMAAFPIDPAGAQALLPDSVRAVRLLGKALLAVTVVNYQETVIGKYIEYSIALACRHGLFGLGQYVYDLPVSTEISVKGGKGIWGMPKHQAPLNFEVSDETVTSQYDLDGQLAAYLEVTRPRLALPLRFGASNYCSFRGMLMKSTVYSIGRAQLGFGRGARGRFEVGDHPRLARLKALGPFDKPRFTAFFPDAHGVLDDHFESWFLEFDNPPEQRPEGFESVIDLGLGEEWPPPPAAPH
ncbi:MAG TPA: acetoacetate decarboxylase family protein [Gaiellaceae bacterium]